MDLPHYQTIPELGIKGRMDTTIEFKAIGLPDNFDKKQGKVLDIGCNAGAFMLECLKRGAKYVVGVDESEEWANRAKETMRYAAEDLKLTGTSVVIQDDAFHYLKKFSTPWIKKFDYVLLLSVTHLVDDPNKLFAWAFRAVMPGGTMILEVNHRLEKTKLVIPESAKFIGLNKDGRSIYHIMKI